MSKLKLGVVMDPIAHIKPAKDTTLALLLEAQQRGMQLHYMELADLYLQDGDARARARVLQVADSTSDWYQLGEAQDLRLGELDLILMRQDPPVDAEFIHATQLLALAQTAGALVVNRPAGLLECNEKLFAQQFPQCCAPTLVSRDMARLRRFAQDQGQVVIKPLDGMGGSAVFRVGENDPNLSVVLETLTVHGQSMAMAQKFLPQIAAGDKRILMLDGEPVPYALARIPAAGESRGNLAAGGRGEGVELSKRDRWICAEVGPALRERGLWFVGLDVIGDFLTEINVTSPTCMRELDRIYGINIAAQLFDKLESALAAGSRGNG